MKILLLGDASNCHKTLADGLRQLGQDVTVASNGTFWMNTDRDIDLLRRLPGKLGGAELWWRVNHRLYSRLSGYDIVAMHNPIFIDLKPHRCQAFLNRLKRDNGALFLTALGTDTPYVEECIDPNSQLRYNEFRHYGAPAPYTLNHPEVERAWLTDPLKSYCDYFYSQLDGAVAVLYEYELPLHRRLPADKIGYGGIPINTDEITPIDLPERPEKVRFFLGRHNYRMDVKGTDRFEVALRRACERHPGKAEIEIVENLPYKEYVKRLRSAHVVIDQAYSYTPATNALLAMAYGQCVVSGGEDAYYTFIGEGPNPTAPLDKGNRPGSPIEEGSNRPGSSIEKGPNRPIFNSPIDVDGMTRLFEDIITHPEELRERGRRSREFVVTHNNYLTVARRYLNFWASHL
jgi:hypothetical protein